jgi:hypothetical protein
MATETAPTDLMNHALHTATDRPPAQSETSAKEVTRHEITTAETQIVSPPGGVTPQAEFSAVINLSTGAVLSKTGLSFAARPTFQQWEETADLLIGWKRMANFHLMDLAKSGQEWFGKSEVIQSLRQRNVQQADLDEIFRLEPIVERRPELSVEHHYAVAQLDEIDQKRWLETAKVHELTPRDLRASIRANDVVKHAGHGSPSSKTSRVRDTETYGTCINDFSAWYRAAAASVPLWSRETVTDALADFQPIIDFIAYLERRRAELRP